jgi:hypothetical protein
MIARARDRAKPIEKRWKRRRRRARKGELPNLIMIGAMKCGTTSLHRYLRLHPEIQMSGPKELNFFCEDLNWHLGVDWYREQFDPASPIRGESSVHYTNFPRQPGVPERMHEVVPDAKLIYMVRDPVRRMISQYMHNKAGGYEMRPIEEVFALPSTSYHDRSRYWMQLERYLEYYPPHRILVASRGELDSDRRGTLRRIFRFLGVDEDFDSPQFEREWETSGGKGGKFSLMDRLARLPGMRIFDKSYDRLPESVYWAIEKVAYSPGGEKVERPELPEDLHRELTERFRGEVRRLEEFRGRRFETWSVNDPAPMPT